VPAILAGGAAIMAVAGNLFFREAPSWQRIVGVAFAIIGFVFAAQIEIDFVFIL
jgi:bacterial/archaeal transporter family protein